MCCCGVVVNYNSDTFSGSQKAMDCKKPDMNGKNAIPGRSGDHSARLGSTHIRQDTIGYRNQAHMIGDFLSGKLSKYCTC
jgi:hypothetical protein